MRVLRTHPDRPRCALARSTRSAVGLRAIYAIRVIFCIAARQLNTFAVLGKVAVGLHHTSSQDSGSRSILSVPSRPELKVLPVPYHYYPREVAVQAWLFLTS